MRWLLAAGPDVIDTGGRIVVGGVTLSTLIGTLLFFWRVQGAYADDLREDLVSCREENAALRRAFGKLAAVVLDVAAGEQPTRAQIAEVVQVVTDFDDQDGS